MEINDRSKADWMKQLNWLEGSISYPAAYFESSDSSKIEFRDKKWLFSRFSRDPILFNSAQFNPI